MNDIRKKHHWHVSPRRHPSAYLLAAQLVSLMLYAALGGVEHGGALLGAFGVVMLALTVWVVNRSPGIVWIAWVLVLPALVLSLLSSLYRDPTLVTLASVLEAAFYFYGAGSLIAYMLGDYNVTSDELFAAGATFTLLAWGFAYLFLACQTLAPGSFTGALNPDNPRPFLELLFLSFTTLSAVGSGDIIPLGSAARVLVMLEQFAGVAYIGVVVSRLIGMTIVRRRDDTR